MKIQEYDTLNNIRQTGVLKILPNKPRIGVGMGTCGIGNGAKPVFETLDKKLKAAELDAMLVPVGCFGYCAVEPLVNVHLPGKPLVVLAEVIPDDVDEIIESIQQERLPKKKVLCKIESWDHITRKINFGEGYPDVPHWDEIPFFKGQQKVVLRNCGLINPSDIQEYIGIGGYQALHQALEMPGPVDVIEEIKKSKLRGRGGAGFPTGNKWSMLQKAEADQKYVICNADEGDPGAYMNRNEIESDPHMLLEGMLIGSYAMGASKGIIYLRAEYPLAVERLKQAIEQAREYGVLGENILGTDFNFDIQLVEGAGAFVCGEETALIASLEGEAGRPRPRPPYPAQKGLWGKPTNINNVETWCNIPVIIARRANWFEKIGVFNGAGTKVFSLVGKIKNTGLVEMPLGAKLKDVIYSIGQGSPTGRKIKAVQTGGPSGGCIPASLFNASIDYDSLKQLGAIMGSGGMVAMDEDTCMVDVARYFIAFSRSESCGKCVPCRVGLDQAYTLLKRITEGEGTEDDLTALESMGNMIRECSLCGLGQTAPNPVLTTLKHFRREYEEHIRKKRCSSGVCEALFMAPCENSCPLNMRIPSFLQLLKEERLEDAAELIWLDNPLPASTGRICQHPCEDRCRRGTVDTPINMREVHRYISDHLFQDVSHEVLVKRLKAGQLESTGKRIAVAGSGPSGLCATFYLAMLGHEVMVYESRDKAGGMLRYALPEYRLPSAVVDREINVIHSLGVQFTFGKKIGKDILIEQLEKDYDAVFLAVGTWKEWNLDLPNEDAPGVWHAIHYLEHVARVHPKAMGKRTVVIGGGNAAIDSARTSVRLGADVTVVYRRDRTDMPAIVEEVDDAEAEGVKYIFFATPKQIVTDKTGRVCEVVFSVTEPGEFDASGRRKPIPTGEVIRMECDNLVIATGERPDSEPFRAAGIRVREDHTVDAHWVSFATDKEKVFAGGDLVTGASNVSSTMATGKAAAKAIDARLGGDSGRMDTILKSFDHRMEVLDAPKKAKRNISEKLAGKERRKHFEEVVCGISLECAKAEAERCLRCDVK